MSTTSEPGNVHAAFDDDSDQFPVVTVTTPSTTRALANELKHFRDMARIESDPPTKALWQSLADQIDAYLNGEPAEQALNLSLFDHGATS